MFGAITSELRDQPVGEFGTWLGFMNLDSIQWKLDLVGEREHSEPLPKPRDKHIFT